MGRARLTRVDAVEEMAAAVEVFRAEATAALETLDMEIHRALDWIHHDRRDFWKHEVSRGSQRVDEARVQLQQAKSARRINDHEPACIDEKKALAKATRRLEIAREKVEAVRHFTRTIERGVDEYRAARLPLVDWLEFDAPKALATLRRMMDTLEEYLGMQSQGGPEPQAQAGAEPHAPHAEQETDKTERSHEAL